MREVFEKVLVGLKEELLDNSIYAPNTCETCIHSNKSIFEHPCNKCVTSTSEYARDYKPTDKYYWSPNKAAGSKSVEEYIENHGLPNIKKYEEYPPERCINPRCSHGNPEVHSRGLCKHCYDILDGLVIQDIDTVESWTMMYWLAGSEAERILIKGYYLELYSWERFELEGKCLPLVEEDPFPDKELIIYYRLCKLNRDRKADKDPTPTKRQLNKHLTQEQIDRLNKYLEIR